MICVGRKKIINVFEKGKVLFMINFNNFISTNPPDQRYGNLRIKALNKHARLFITKTTGNDHFNDYTVDFYDSWIKVNVGKSNHWYPIKSILDIREENNFTNYEPIQE